MHESIRPAEQSDYDAISDLDRLATGTALDRSVEIARAIAESRCTVVVSDSEIQGFAIVIPKAFRRMDFLDLIVVSPSSRRQGIATLLIAHFCNMSNTYECWTSTNASNQIMISLLRKLGWHESDHVEELDLGDPECFFFWRQRIR